MLYVRLFVMGTQKCCVGGCNATCETRLFSFPKNDELRNLWMSFLVPTNSLLIGLTKEQLLRKRVCEKHFDKHQFDHKGQRLRYSYPCLLTAEEIAHGVPLSVAGWDVTLEHNYFKEQDEEDVTETSPVITTTGCTGSIDHNYSKEQDDSVLTTSVLIGRAESWPATEQNEDIHEVDLVCRVCLAMDVKMYDLNDIEMREMFQNITGIAVTENNHRILEHLCWECAGRLKAAAAFRNKALLSDALLQGLANTGKQIQKHDITLIKDSEDYLKTAATLTVVEAFHTVDIDPENDGMRPSSENNDTKIVQNTVRKDFLKQKNESIIEEDNDQTDVEDESMIEAPVNTEMEYDQFDRIRPNTGEESSNVFVETNPLFSSNIPLKEATTNSGNSIPPPRCSHVKPKYPILGYRRKTPGDCEDKVKKHVMKITKRDSVSKIVSNNSKELITAKSKNMNAKISGISKKISNINFLKNTQGKYSYR